MSKDFSRKLKYLRLHHGLTQRQVAQRGGMSSTTVCYFEGGVWQQPNFETVRKFAKALDVPAEELLDCLS